MEDVRWVMENGRWKMENVKWKGKNVSGVFYDQDFCRGIRDCLRLNQIN